MSHPTYGRTLRREYAYWLRDRLTTLQRVVNQSRCFGPFQGAYLRGYLTGWNVGWTYPTSEWT